MTSWSVGIDTGGTFTDLAAVDHKSGRMFVAKVPSTPHNPADAIMASLEQFSESCAAPLSNLAMFGHGTTVATNALLEGRGARAGLIITQGFRAAYLARAGTRPRGPDLVSPFYKKSPPLIPLQRTFEVKERIGFDGAITTTMSDDDVRSAAQSLKAMGCDSVAVCFLFSFLNDVHERRAASIIREICPTLRISLSCDILPVIRESPRISTVALDAYVGPVVGSYFTSLGERASKSGINEDRIFIMQSNGGLMRLNLAASYPNETLLSGPAAGIAFATELAARCGYKNIVTFDMGGTSTDACLIQDRRAAIINNGVIGGQEIGTPMVEIRTIGAGGGAIAHIGEDGLLKVGPRSAGANPGPACYGKGGTEATVTDANVVLGYVDATRFIGGELKGNAGLAEDVLKTLGDSFGFDTLAAANGVRRIVNSHMASALRLSISDRGGDPRDTALLAFGGCGPLHAAEVAEEIGIGTVIVPVHPGVACAMGLLMTDVRHTYSKSAPQLLAPTAVKGLEDGFRQLSQRAREDARREGFNPDKLIILREIDVRYQQQGYQLKVDVPEKIDEHAVEAVRKNFDKIHEATYGTCAPNELAEIVTLRVVSIMKIPHISPASPAASTGSAKPIATRAAWFNSTQCRVDTPVYARTDLRPGERLTGPLVVEQLDSTTLVGPGHLLEVDTSGNLIIAIPTSHKG